jgi:hypothetical protein
MTSTARHLRLVTREEMVAAAVRELDERIAPRHPIASPIKVGALEHFPCQYEDGFTAWRYHNAGGRDLVVRLPAELDTEETDSAVRRFMTELLAIQHRLR